jgi:hypothetical protein
MAKVWLHGASGYRTQTAALEARPIVVGRAGDLRLDDDNIEKKHARFVLRGNEVFVAQLSKGAVRLDGAPLAGEAPLEPGDIVLLSTWALVLVASWSPQPLTKRARKAIDELARYQRDAVWVQLLQSVDEGLVAQALAQLAAVPRLRLVSHERTLVAWLDQRAPLAAPALAAPIAALAAHLDQPPPRPAALRAPRQTPALASLPVDEPADPEHGLRRPRPLRAWHVRDVSADVGHGYTFGLPPIEPSGWPRSPRNGWPMAHLATLLVPSEYRVLGPERVAFSLFQADDHARARVERSATHEGAPDTNRWYLEDSIGGAYAVFWHDRQTFARGPAEGPPPEGLVVKPARFVELRARLDDPNVGLEIAGWDDPSPGGYVPFVSERGRALGLERFLCSRCGVRAHFGGTSVACDDFDGGLGPLYMGLEDNFGGANFGGGNAVLDLARRSMRFGQ